MNILVTGSAGFIAGYTVERLLEEGHKVFGIDNFSKYGKVKKSYDKHPNYSFIQADVKNTNLLKELIKDCEQILCLAALVGGITYFNKFPFDIISENEKITASTLEAALWAFKNHKLNKINIVSSSMVYENTSIFPSKEEHTSIIPPPDSSYGFQKLSCEYFVKAAYLQYGLPYTIIRPFNCVGTGEYRISGKEIESDGNIVLTMGHVVPDIIKKILLGQDPVSILGSGRQIRHYTYGKDLADGILRCIVKKEAVNQTFNISNGKSTNVLELVDMIWKKINPQKPFSYKLEKGLKYDVQKRIPDIKKAEDILGFKAETELEKVIDELIPWIKNEIKKGNI